jgi:hypothetical protein
MERNGWSRAMKRSCKVLLVVGLVVVAGVLFLAFQNGPTYDPARVNPRLRALQEPYKKVMTAYYLDGGSIAIEIVDRDGRDEVFFMPYSRKREEFYTRLWIGTIGSPHRPGAVVVAEPEHTIRMLTRILADYPKRSSWDDDNLMRLRGYPKDHIRVLWQRWWGRHDSP